MCNAIFPFFRLVRLVPHGFITVRELRSASWAHVIFFPSFFDRLIFFRDRHSSSDPPLSLPLSSARVLQIGSNGLVSTGTASASTFFHVDLYGIYAYNFALSSPTNGPDFMIHEREIEEENGTENRKESLTKWSQTAFCPVIFGLQATSLRDGLACHFFASIGTCAYSYY